MISIFTTLNFALLGLIFIQICVKISQISANEVNFNQIMSAARSYSIKTESHTLNITQLAINLAQTCMNVRLNSSQSRAFPMQTPVSSLNIPLASSGNMLRIHWAFPGNLSSIRSCFNRTLTPLRAFSSQ